MKLSTKRNILFIIRYFYLGSSAQFILALSTLRVSFFCYVLIVVDYVFSCITTLSTVWQKTAPFSFEKNFVKSLRIEIVIGTQILQ